MFIAALFTITKVWKQPKCLSKDEWIKKIWHIYIYICVYIYIYIYIYIYTTSEYLYSIVWNGIYSAIKMNEILPFAAMWMDLGGIMLSEISQTEEDKYCMISLICGIKKIQQISEYNKKETDSQT